MYAYNLNMYVRERVSEFVCVFKDILFIITKNKR